MPGSSETLKGLLESSNETPRARTLEAISSAAGPVTFRWRTMALFAFPSFGVVLLSNQSRLGGDLLEWFAIGCIGYAVTIAVLLAFRFTLLPAHARGPRVLLTMVAFFVAGTLRGLCVWLVGTSWGLVPKDDLLFRLTSGFLLVFGAMATISIYEAARIRQEQALVRLEAEKAILDELRGGIRERIRISQQELLQKVQDIITPIVAQLRTDLTKADSKSAVENIQAAVENLVRPLSREMGSAGSVFEQEILADARQVSATKIRGVWPAKVLVGSMMVPALTIFAVLTTAIGPLSLVLGQAAGPAFVLIVAIAAAISFGWQRLLSRSLAPVWLAYLLALVSAPVMALVTDQALNVFDWRLKTATMVQYVILNAFIITVTFALQMSRTLRAQHETQLVTVIRDLGVLNSQLKQEVWFNRRRTAAVLHGPIQAALYSSAMRLDPAQKPSDALVEALQNDIATALAKLDGANLVEPFDSVVRQIQDVWQGIANVEHEPLAPNVVAALNQNPTASSCVLEIIREAVSNAIKHGRASQVRFKIALSNQFLEVTVANNGAPIADTKIAGYGSEILDEVCFEWSLKSEAEKKGENTTILRALVAI